MSFVELIQYIIHNGYVSAAGTVGFGIAALVLLIKNNGVSKLLANTKVSMEDLFKKLVDISDKLEEAEKVITNSNEMISCCVDIIHIAYSASNLDINTKLQLQKLYDKCPDALTEVKNELFAILNTPATEEQIEIVKETESESAVNTIIEKLK